MLRLESGGVFFASALPSQATLAIRHVPSPAVLRLNNICPLLPVRSSFCTVFFSVAGTSASPASAGVETWTIVWARNVGCFLSRASENVYGIYICGENLYELLVELLVGFCEKQDFESRSSVLVLSPSFAKGEILGNRTTVSCSWQVSVINFVRRNSFSVIDGGMFMRLLYVGISWSVFL